MTTNTNTHPFRANSLHPVCTVCEAPAHLRCPRCRRPFCIDHAAMGPCCTDCAEAAAKKEEKVSLTSVASYAAAVGGLSSYLFALAPALGVMAGVAGVRGGILVSAVAHRIARGRATGWEPVDGTALRVGRDGGPERAHRDLVVGRTGLRSFQVNTFRASMGQFRL
jgi:hypothetical protein